MPTLLQALTVMVKKTTTTMKKATTTMTKKVMTTMTPEDNFTLDLGPEDSPETVKPDLIWFWLSEIEDMYLTQSPELDPYLQSERLRKDCAYYS